MKELLRTAWSWSVSHCREVGPVMFFVQAFGAALVVGLVGFATGPLIPLFLLAGWVLSVAAFGVPIYVAVFARQQNLAAQRRDPAQLRATSELLGDTATVDCVDRERKGQAWQDAWAAARRADAENDPARRRALFQEAARLGLQISGAGLEPGERRTIAKWYTEAGESQKAVVLLQAGDLPEVDEVYVVELVQAGLDPAGTESLLSILFGRWSDDGLLRGLPGAMPAVKKCSAAWRAREIEPRVERLVEQSAADPVGLVRLLAIAVELGSKSVGQAIVSRLQRTGLDADDLRTIAQGQLPAHQLEGVLGATASVCVRQDAGLSMATVHALVELTEQTPPAWRTKFLGQLLPAAAERITEPVAPGDLERLHKTVSSLALDARASVIAAALKIADRWIEQPEPPTLPDIARVVALASGASVEVRDPWLARWLPAVCERVDAGYSVTAVTGLLRTIERVGGGMATDLTTATLAALAPSLTGRHRFDLVPLYSHREAAPEDLQAQLTVKPEPREAKELYKEACRLAEREDDAADLLNAYLPADRYLREALDLPAEGRVPTPSEEQKAEAGSNLHGALLYRWGELWRRRLENLIADAPAEPPVFAHQDVDALPDALAVLYAWSDRGDQLEALASSYLAAVREHGTIDRIKASRREASLRRPENRRPVRSMPEQYEMSEMAVAMAVVFLNRDLEWSYELDQQVQPSRALAEDREAAAQAALARLQEDACDSQAHIDLVEAVCGITGSGYHSFGMNDDDAHDWAAAHLRAAVESAPGSNAAWQKLADFLALDGARRRHAEWHGNVASAVARAKSVTRTADGSGYVDLSAAQAVPVSPADILVAFSQGLEDPLGG